MRELNEIEVCWKIIGSSEESGVCPCGHSIQKRDTIIVGMFTDEIIGCEKCIKL